MTIKFKVILYILKFILVNLCLKENGEIEFLLEQLSPILKNEEIKELLLKTTNIRNERFTKE